jgi:hypothetical protein
VRPRLVIVALILVIVVAGCGNAASTSSTAASTSPPTVGADPGPGAAFAPKGSLLYVRTSGTGPAWDALTKMRDRVKGFNNFDPADSVQMLMRLMTAEDFAEGSASLRHALSGEGSEVLVSDRRVKSADADYPAADMLAYSGVADHTAMAGYLDAHYTRDGSDGTYALYRGRKDYTGFSALSDDVWLWATSSQLLHQAIATAAGDQPSLLDDQSFTSSMAAVDASGAALVAYTRGDLASELSHSWDPTVKVDPVGTGLTNGLGLADTALAVGADANGVWMRAAPHVLADGYHPGPVFTPSLVDQVPASEIVYLGIKDSGSQVGGISGLVSKMLAGDSDEPNGNSIDSLVQGLFGLSPSDVASVDDGEEAWFYGTNPGAAFTPSDPEKAEAVLATAAHSRPGATSGRDGDVVWIHTGSRVSSEPMPGPTPAELVKNAGPFQSVSLVLAVDVGILGELQDTPSSQAKPLDSVAGVVLSAAPGSDGRYQLRLYMQIAGS